VAKAKREQTVLVVDDVPINIDVLDGVLNQDYKVKAAINGERALEIAHSKEPPDLILLDIMMPGIDGYEVCRRLKADIATRKIPVIFVTAMGEVEDETKGFKVGAVDYITKPISPPIVKERVKTHLALYDQNLVLEQKVKERTIELNKTRLEIIQRLGVASEYKDEETGLHIVRMSYYSQLIARAAGMGEDEAELLLNAAPMHDVGKIGIPDKILTKPGKLDAQEWEVMKTHTTIGVEILGKDPSELLSTARIIALTHHEKWNGAGYPKGLSTEEIHKYGRIVAIADVFDALTSKRPYKEAWSFEKAVDEIKKSAGTHFDPAYADAFLNTIPQVMNIYDQYS
jgi:putative two-component system response regulator